MLSHALYYLESNTRSATILGVVGAGGIGLHLADRIRVNNWDEVSFILIMILVTVTGIDLVSKAIRWRFIQAGTSGGSEAASGGLNSHLGPTPKYATITSHCGGPPAADAWSRHGYPACQSLQ